MGTKIESRWALVGLDGESAVKEKWSGLGYISKAEMAGLADGMWFIEMREKEGSSYMFLGGEEDKLGTKSLFYLSF